MISEWLCDTEVMTPGVMMLKIQLFLKMIEIENESKILQK